MKRNDWHTDHKHDSGVGRFILKLGYTSARSDRNTDARKPLWQPLFTFSTSSLAPERTGGYTGSENEQVRDEVLGDEIIVRSHEGKRPDLPLKHSRFVPGRTLASSGKTSAPSARESPRQSALFPASKTLHVLGVCLSKKGAQTDRSARRVA